MNTIDKINIVNETRDRILEKALPSFRTDMLPHIEKLHLVALPLLDNNEDYNDGLVLYRGLMEEAIYESYSDIVIDPDFAGWSFKFDVNTMQYKKSLRIDNI